MTQLSVNINKFATLRNARGGNNPNIVRTAKDCVRFGAQGITVHPRPDQRHITQKDVYEINQEIHVEFNIEGYPDPRFLRLIQEIRPTQVTLVPDPPDVLTSNAGWDTIEHQEKLSTIVSKIRAWGARTSLFVAPDMKMIEGAKACAADRVELYTQPYAARYRENKNEAIKNYKEAAEYAHQIGLGVNAGHDLDLDNLKFMHQEIPFLKEVSIGHALICDALYYGLENTIQMYLRALK